MKAVIDPPSRGHRPLRRSPIPLATLAGFVLLGALPATAQVLPAAPPVGVQPPSTVQPPQVPAQPGLAVPSCHHTPPAPGSWRLLSVSGTHFQATAESRTGCLYRATDAETLQRSADDGFSWQPILHDDRSGSYVPGPGDPTCHGSLTACDASTQPFEMTGMAVPQPGVLLATEDRAGDGLLRSGDRGRTWTLTNRGLEGQAVDRVITTQDPKVDYALTNGVVATIGSTGRSAAPQLYRSRDGGGSWVAASLPFKTLVAQNPYNGTAITDAVQIDPGDANHVLAALLYPSNVSSATPVCTDELFDSSDGGSTWQPRGSAPSALCQFPVQLSVIHSPRHPWRLAVVADYRSTTSAVEVSDDGGRSWAASAVPAQPVAAGACLSTGRVVADTRDPDRLVYINVCASGSSAWWATSDGFDHVERIPPLLFGPPGSYTAELSSDGSGAFGFNSSQAAGLAALESGDFLVSLNINCLQGLSVQPSRVVCTGGGDKPAGRLWMLWDVTPPPSGTAALPPSGTAPGTAAGSASTSRPPRALTQAGTPCAIPPDTRKNNAGAQAGTIAFDGYELLYTHLNETGSPAPQYNALIHAIAPRTCTPLSDILVHFQQSDVQEWSDAQGVSIPDAIWIDDMTYDARCNCLWAAIAPPNAGAQGLFQIRVTDRRTTPRQAWAQLVMPDIGCNWALSYDQFHNTLWTCPQGSASTPTEISAVDGSQLPTCMSALAEQAGAQVGGMAAWTSGGAHHLYVLSEDDATIWDYDPESCVLNQTFVHNTYAEPPDEDEEAACDSLTYGPDGVAAIGGPTSVLWLRDAAGSLADSYAVADAACPVPTTTTFSTPTPSVGVDSMAELCATLQQLYPGGSVNLPGMPISFTLSGPVTVKLPAVTTRGDRTPAQPSCVPWTAKVPAGSYAVAANFDPAAAHRTAQYRPSAGTGTLTVVATPLSGAAPHATTVPILQPPPNPPPGNDVTQAPAGQAEIAQQAQAQAQAESQIQSQANAQSATQIQPGMMTQRQRQRQAARQEARIVQGDTRSQSLMATRLVHRQQWAWQVAAGALLLGFGLLRRRPAVHATSAEVRNPSRATPAVARADPRTPYAPPREHRSRR